MISPKIAFSQFQVCLKSWFSTSQFCHWGLAFKIQYEVKVKECTEVIFIELSSEMNDLAPGGVITSCQFNESSFRLKCKIVKFLSGNGHCYLVVVNVMFFTGLLKNISQQVTNSLKIGKHC